MAASLSRPDPSSPASVAEASFSTARRGFHQDEVRAFLVAVGAEIGRLQERERQLESELRDALAAAEAVPSQLDEATVTELLGEETVRVLQTARESASQIKIRAEETAARLLREANDEVNRLRQETEVDLARRRQDATADAEAEVALAKQQGREMVNEARAYRERVLADLDRRTTLARKQIEELIHGRDRLLQVFERARLVAVDVTSELRDIDTPDELVNLTPTTGPVPIMVPSERRQQMAAERAGRDDTAEETGVESSEQAVDDADVERATDEPDVESVDDDTVPDAIDSESVDDDTVDDDTVDDTVSAADGDDAAVEVAEHAPDDEPEPDAVVERAEDAADDAGEAVDDEEPHGDAVAAIDEGEPGQDAVGAVVEDDSDAAEVAGRDGTSGTRDDNVVSLFRDRAVPVGEVDDSRTDDDAGADAADEDAADDAADEDAADEDAADEVGGIFARLRDELPTTDTVVPGGAATVEPDADVATVEQTDERDAPDAAAETAFTRRNEALVPLIVGAARKIKRVLADEQNGVLDRLRQKEPVTTLADLVPDVDEHAAAYRNAIDDELVGAAAAGAVEAGAKDTRTVRNRLGRAGALDDATALIRTALIAPLRDRLERSIADGAGDSEAITRRVRAVYREWKTQHIDTQLDDVFRFAHGGGIAVTVEPGSPMVWTIDPAQSACPDCEDNSLSGAVPAGEPFPTGHATAPAHPGCHCLVLPAE